MKNKEYNLTDVRKTTWIKPQKILPLLSYWLPRKKNLRYSQKFQENPQKLEFTDIMKDHWATRNVLYMCTQWIDDVKQKRRVWGASIKDTTEMSWHYRSQVLLLRSRPPNHLKKLTKIQKRCKNYPDPTKTTDIWTTKNSQRESKSWFNLLKRS